MEKAIKRNYALLRAYKLKYFLSDEESLEQIKDRLQTLTWQIKMQELELSKLAR